MSIAHRTEIDGLRALAVLPVIFFHAGFPFFSGGYVGVDVFFVISGFLITSILLDEHERRTFSIAAFYERRVRRILPALLLVLTCALPFAYAMLSPLDLRAFAKNLLAANLFIGNVVAYQQTDYFAAASEIKPLLHLWSLGIEEQYYLVLPLLLAFLVRRGRFSVLLTLALLCAASLAYSEQALKVSERAAFFFTHSRAWELLVGSLCAAMRHYRWPSAGLCGQEGGRWAWLLASVGLLMVAVPIHAYSKNTPFPGLYATVPAVGTALILLFSQGTWVQRLLSVKPLVAIGLISYSAYLWHQPVFAFARYRSLENLSAWTMLGLVALTLVLASLSWYFVERPFRNKSRFSRRQVWLLTGLPTVVLSAVAIYLYNARGLPERFDPRYAEAFFPRQFQEDGFCKFKPLWDARNLQGCDFGDPQGKQLVFLVGDSHASSLLGGLHEAFKRDGVRGVRVKVLGCPHQIPGMISASVTAEKIAASQQCQETYQTLSKLIATHADSVVLSVRWTARFAPIPGEVEEFFFNNQEGGVELKPNIGNFARDASGQWSVGAEAKKQALHRFLEYFSDSGKKLVLVYPVPEAGWDVPRYNFTHYLQTGGVPPVISTSYPLYLKRNRFVIQGLDDHATPHLIRLRPSEYFCNTALPDRCVAQENFKPYYHDTNHLSLSGAQALTQDIARMIAR